MKKNKIFLWCGLGFCAVSMLVFLGCTPEKKSEVQDPVIEATRAMDRGDFTSGILKLEKILSEKPTDDRARIALASGYMGRAGLTVDRFYKFADSFLDKEVSANQDSPLHRLTNRLRSHSGKEQNILTEFLINLENLLDDTDALLRRIDQIPEVNEKQVNDVKLALEHLLLLQKPTGGQQLYRSIARLVLLKNDLNGARWSQLSNLGFCGTSVSFIQNFLTSIHTEISLILTDAEVALPKSRDKLGKLRSQVSIAYLALSKLLLVDSPESQTLLAIFRGQYPSLSEGQVQCNF